VIDGSELDEWREYRKSMGEQDDPKLNNIPQLSCYFFSIGTGAIGISTYSSFQKKNETFSSDSAMSLNWLTGGTLM